MSHAVRYNTCDRYFFCCGMLRDVLEFSKKIDIRISFILYKDFEIRGDGFGRTFKMEEHTEN